MEAALDKGWQQERGVGLYFCCMFHCRWWRGSPALDTCPGSCPWCLPVQLPSVFQPGASGEQSWGPSPQHLSKPPNPSCGPPHSFLGPPVLSPSLPCTVPSSPELLQVFLCPWQVRLSLWVVMRSQAMLPPGHSRASGKDLDKRQSEVGGRAPSHVLTGAGLL